MKIATRYTITLAGKLVVFALLAITMTISVYYITAQRIEYLHAKKLQDQLHSVLPWLNAKSIKLKSFDPYSDQSLAESNLFVKGKNAYRVCSSSNKVLAVIIEVITLKGYNGAIKLLIGIQSNGHITGVRVLAENETPGLGDKIESRISNWIDSFTGKSLDNPTIKAWQVKKDGGIFDQFTGATITPRAVVNVVRDTLIQVKKFHTLLFNHSLCS